MAEPTWIVAFAVPLQLLLGCAPSRIDCDAAHPDDRTRLPAGYPEACREWPHAPALRAKLTEQAFQLLEAIYGGRETAAAMSLLDESGVSVELPTQAESGPLEFRRVPPERFHELFDGALARQMMGGIHGLRGRAVDVGARWSTGPSQLCVRNTERTAGMFEGAVYVHLFRTAVEAEAGHPNGIVLTFEPDGAGGWSVTALFSTEQGV